MTEPPCLSLWERWHLPIPREANDGEGRPRASYRPGHPLSRAQADTRRDSSPRGGAKINVPFPKTQSCEVPMANPVLDNLRDKANRLPLLPGV